MTPLHTIIRETAQLVMAVGFLGFWLYLMHTKARRASDEREQKAGLQTLFNGRK